MSCWGEALEQIGERGIKVKITGSGSISLGKALNIDFVQEVVTVASALQFIAPQTDVAIELGGEDAKSVSLPALIDRLNGGIEMSFELNRVQLLFSSQEEYDRFLSRHAKAVVPKAELETYSGNCFLGIDAGSTTTKIALIGSEGQLLYSYYANNQGSPIKTAMNAVADLKEHIPASAHIVRGCSTGYGEALLKSAFGLPDHLVFHRPGVHNPFRYLIHAFVQALHSLSLSPAKKHSLPHRKRSMRWLNSSSFSLTRSRPSLISERISSRLLRISE